MPEGDTIARAARSLSRALVGATLTAVRSPLGAIAHARLVGHKVVGIDTHGKNLVMRFDDGRALHTHMQMSGSWHIYRPGERWRQSPGAARVVFEVLQVRPDGGPPVPFVVVCFRAPVVRLLDRVQATTDARLLALGPDILAPDLDIDEVVRRMRADVDRPLGDAVLDQHLVAGIGNIYKSETLFLTKEDPFRRVADVDDERLRTVLTRARELMQANTSPVPALANRGSTRVTRFALGGPRYWVYKRSGEACLVCGATLAMRRQGEALRSTYYCPACQQTTKEA